MKIFPAFFVLPVIGYLKTVINKNQKIIQKDLRNHRPKAFFVGEAFLLL